MTNLLRIEYTKISKYTSFKIVLGGYAVLAIALFLSIHNFTFGPFQLFGQETLKFPYVWQNVAFVAKFLNLALGIIIALLIGNEYSYDTAKQNVIDGLRRDEIVYSKYMVVFGLAIISTILIGVICLILGFINSVEYDAGLIIKNIGFLFSFFLHAIALLSMAAFISFLFRKTAIAILFFLAYAVFVEAIFRGVIDAEFTKYFPSKSINNLVQTPYADFVANMEISLQTSPWNEYMLVATAYAAIFMILSLILVRKRNL